MVQYDDIYPTIVVNLLEKTVLNLKQSSDAADKVTRALLEVLNQ